MGFARSIQPRAKLADPAFCLIQHLPCEVTEEPPADRLPKMVELGERVAELHLEIPSVRRRSPASLNLCTETFVHPFRDVGDGVRGEQF